MLTINFLVPDNPEDHNIVIARREAIGEWFKNVIRKTLEHEAPDVSNETKMLQLLSGVYTSQEQPDSFTFFFFSVE